MDKKEYILVENMEWYEKLHDYFPEHEMKDPHQLVDLLEETDVYHIKETDSYIVLYAEFTTFIFIDYLLVTPHSRSRGIGSRVLNSLKTKGKMILLEAEPNDPDNEDTRRRLAFTKRMVSKKPIGSCMLPRISMAIRIPCIFYTGRQLNWRKRSLWAAWKRHAKKFITLNQSNTMDVF